MENLKKKRSEVRGDARISGKKIKGCDSGGVTADDAEIDEFFAILKRLQTGFNYFQKKGSDDYCDGKSVAPPPPPAFELEDFIQVDGDDGGIMKRSDDGEPPENGGVVGFDLNADPVTD